MSPALHWQGLLLRNYRQSQGKGDAKGKGGWRLKPPFPL